MTHRPDAFHPRPAVAKLYTDAAMIEDTVRRLSLAICRQPNSTTRALMVAL